MAFRPWVWIVLNFGFSLKINRGKFSAKAIDSLPFNPRPEARPAKPIRTGPWQFKKGKTLNLIVLPGANGNGKL
jgi:hypothetical protein